MGLEVKSPKAAVHQTCSIGREGLEADVCCVSGTPCLPLNRSAPLPQRQDSVQKGRLSWQSTGFAKCHLNLPRLLKQNKRLRSRPALNFPHLPIKPSFLVAVASALGGGSRWRATKRSSQDPLPDPCTHQAVSWYVGDVGMEEIAAQHTLSDHANLFHDTRGRPVLDVAKGFGAPDPRMR